MGINQNHLFEDLDNIKCAVVEKNVPQQRVDFLKPLLEFNGYNVIIVGSPPPKATPGAEALPVEAPTTFTVGVTDVRFNSTNAIYGRLLKTTDGRVVTQAYWMQKEKTSDDSVPYFEKK